MLSDAHWEWAAREVPPQLLDPYRVEALLRTLKPGPVFVIGNSTAEESIDAGVLDAVYADRGLRFEKLTIGGSRAVTFGMLLPAIERLDPAGIILMYTPASISGRSLAGRIHAYDVRMAARLFTPREVVREPGIHLRGLVQQSHVLARHRAAMQRTALVELGWYAWWKLRRHLLLLQLEEIRSGAGLRRFFDGLRRRRDRFPNPNTRAISAIAAMARERGIPFVVVEAPSPPTMRLPLLARPRLRAREEMAALAEADGFTFVSAEELPELGGDDFKDLVHLNEQGRAKFTARFSDILQPIL